MILDNLNKKYFDREFSQEKKCFNLAQIAVMVVYALLVYESLLLRYNYKCLMIVSIGWLVTYGFFYVGKITERYVATAIIIAAILNLFVLPGVYVINKKVISGVMISFMFGMLYCVISLTGVIMFIALFISLASFVSAVIYVGSRYQGYLSYTIATTGLTAFEQISTTVITGLLCGICVKKLMNIYNEEQDKASETVKRSELSSDSKDTFLANMSHEIRTPMNAILGTSQLLLESDLEDEQDKVLNILNATNALLSSINDMLDITRIETGVITIEEEEYDFADMLTDIINMISIRVMDRNIEFVVNVDADIPRKLYGDGKRIRQIFINILNNAVKYTKDGTITLTVRREVYLEDEILITATVKDTGVGIKDADKERLFVEFERLDTVNDGLENVEGTGLGLSICKEILKTMGGDISFDSVYGEGTEFYFRVPQKLLKSGDEIVEVENIGVRRPEFENFKVLLFEKTEECDNTIASALDSMGIESESAFGVEMFRSMLMRNSYSHAIVDRANYLAMEDFLRNHLHKTKLIVVTDINKTEIKGCPGAVLIRPIYTANLSDYFAGKRHSLIRRINVRGNFIAPSAKVMTVDDNITNLHVVESILSKYQMKVYTASGGKEALLKLEQEEVDLIFLDYMMPGMDGVDTLKRIREIDADWAKKVPIVCLTANAVGGVREMLLSEGFDDYISKPIEMSKLERTIIKFLPESYIESISE